MGAGRVRGGAAAMRREGVRGASRCVWWCLRLRCWLLGAGGAG